MQQHVRPHLQRQGLANMVFYVSKILVTSILIVLISEVSKRNTYIGALLASIPMVSVLALIWLYFDTKDLEKISQLATSIFWLVIPSLGFFVALPLLLRSGIDFYVSIFISIVITASLYWMTTVALRHFNISL